MQDRSTFYTCVQVLLGALEGRRVGTVGKVQQRGVEEVGPPIDRSGQIIVQAVAESDVTVPPEHGGREYVEPVNGGAVAIALGGEGAV